MPLYLSSCAVQRFHHNCCSKQTFVNKRLLSDFPMLLKNFVFTHILGHSFMLSCNQKVFFRDHVTRKNMEKPLSSIHYSSCIYCTIEFALRRESTN